MEKLSPLQEKAITDEFRLIWDTSTISISLNDGKLCLSISKIDTQYISILSRAPFEFKELLQMSNQWSPFHQTALDEIPEDLARKIKQ
jgi:hypothetical protein